MKNIQIRDFHNEEWRKLFPITTNENVKNEAGSNLDEQLDDLSTEFGDIITNLEDRVDDKFIGVNNKFEEVETNLSEVDTNLKEKIMEIYVNVKDFGAKGDGITDDTIAIQNAINSDPKILYFPIGNYKITTTLFLDKDIELCGHDKLYTKLIYEGEGDLLRSTAKFYVVTRDIAFHGTPSYPTDAFKTGTIFANFDTGANMEMYNSWVKGFEYGVTQDIKSYYHKFIGTRFEYIAYVLKGFSANNLIIDNCRALRFNTFLRVVSHFGPVNITNSSFEGFNGAIVETGTSATNIGLNFHGNYIEIMEKIPFPTNFPVADNNPIAGEWGGQRYLFGGGYVTLSIKYNTIQAFNVRRYVWCKAVQFYMTDNSIFKLEGMGVEMTASITGCVLHKIMNTQHYDSENVGYNVGYIQGVVPGVNVLNEHYDWYTNTVKTP